MCVCVCMYNLYTYKKSGAGLCSANASLLYIYYNNSLLCKGNTSSLHYPAVKLNFVLSCWCFETENKYLTIQHSEDRLVFVKDKPRSLFETEQITSDL